MGALRAGNLRDAESHALAIANTETGPLFIQLLQLFSIRRLQGRTDELLPLIESLAIQHPRIITINAHLALGYAETGNTEAAAAVLLRLGTITPDEIAQDVSWNATLVALAEATALLGDADQAKLLLKLLKPYSGNQLVQGAVCYLGAADYYLGQLSLTVNKSDDAQAYFEQALTQHREIECPPMQMKTLLALQAIAQTKNDTAGAISFAQEIEALTKQGLKKGWLAQG